MRILHTSDWHLGKSIHGQSLDLDQADALGRIEEELGKGYRCLIIAGDVFDRAIPPTNALDLLSGFLDRVTDRGIEVVIVPGNHDNPERLGFGSGIMVRGGVHIRCRYEDCTDPVIVEEGIEKVQIFCLPFVEEALVRSLHQEEGISDHTSAVSFLISRMRERIIDGIPSILVAHEYTRRDVFTSDSERELLLGNQGRVPTEIFKGFDYVALGHLHGPQIASSECNAHYSGSILQYSFSESEHKKGIISLDIGAGGITKQRVPIKPLRRMSILEDTLYNILNDPRYDAYSKDYLCIRLTDTCQSVDVLARLRERFHHPLEVQLVHLSREGTDRDMIRQALDSPKDLFSLFLDHFGWVDEIKRERAMVFFEEARRKASERERRGRS